LIHKRAVYDELKRNPNNVRFNRYAIEIFYSEEDEGYISIVPERQMLWRRPLE